MQTKTQGCGCGGASAGRGGCGCGAGAQASALPPSAIACAPCATPAFVRPRFFAGQLLTEDDLGLLVDYALAKQRFHATRLLGAGVVCGLAVSCSPRGDSRVVIEAGYALDGCGNDVVLTCERTLDLTPMIRELTARTRGGDCADPCRRYDLYVRYVERPDQPIAAYAVGDACDASGAPSCEATRILEDVTFELRCPPGLSAPTPARAQGAAGAAESTAGLLERTRVYGEYHRQLARALERSERVSAAALEPLDGEELERLRHANRDLDDVLAGYPAEQRLSMIGEYLIRVAAPLLRAVRRGAPSDSNILAGIARQQIVDNAARAADSITIAMCDPAVKLLASERTLLLEAARLWHEASETPPTASLTPAAQLYLYGAVVTPAMLAALSGEITELAQRLQSSAACRDEISADCSLRDLIDGLSPRWRADGALVGEARVLSGQLGPVVDAIHRFAEDRRIVALNPPCAAPGETAVLLARVEVDRCKVVRIWNTVRSYVLAPTALRYWGAVRPPDDSGGGATAASDAASANEVAELRRSYAALERRLRELEAELAAHAARTQPPPVPTAAATKGAP